MKYLHASIFQRACPADVGSFIEAGFQLDYNRNFLALCCLHQGAHDRRVFIGPVERLPDGKHLRVVGCGLDEGNYGLIES